MVPEPPGRVPRLAPPSPHPRLAAPARARVRPARPPTACAHGGPWPFLPHGGITQALDLGNALDTHYTPTQRPPASRFAVHNALDARYVGLTAADARRLTDGGKPCGRARRQQRGGARDSTSGGAIVPTASCFPGRFSAFPLDATRIALLLALLGRSATHHGLARLGPCGARVARCGPRARSLSDHRLDRWNVRLDVESRRERLLGRPFSALDRALCSLASHGCSSALHPRPSLNRVTTPSSSLCLLRRLTFYGGSPDGMDPDRKSVV